MLVNRDVANRVRWAVLAVSLLVSMSLIGFSYLAHMRYEQEHILRSAFTEILESGTTAYVLVDDDGIVLSWSPGAEKIFGWSKSEAVGYGLGAILPPDMRERHRIAFGGAVNKGGVDGVVVRKCEAITRSGDRIPVVLNIRSIDTPDGLRFMATIDKACHVDTASI